MFTNYGLKILKLAIIILNASYFAGMFWLIFCELTLYFNKDDAYVQITKLLEKHPYFHPKEYDYCKVGGASYVINDQVKINGLEAGVKADCLRF
mgnify:CR=1 FL=1